MRRWRDLNPRHAGLEAAALAKLSYTNINKKNPNLSTGP
jgi:hypothetical protein